MKLLNIFIILITVLLYSNYGYCSTEDLDVSALETSVDESKLYASVHKEENDKKASEALSALRAVSKARAVKKSYANEFKSIDSAAKTFFVVARVNSEVITNIDIINATKFIFFSSGKKYDKESTKIMAKTIVNSMAESKLQEQYAKLYRKKVTETDLNKKVEEIAQKNGMSIEDLTKKFEELGINMEIFKKNIKSRMIVSFIAELIGEDVRVSNQEIAEEKAKIAMDIKCPRCHLFEIFFRVANPKGKKTVKENAEAALKLIRDGFSFQILSENMSQGNYTGTVGDLGWVRSESLETPVRDIVLNLNPGEFSDVIETKTGYKIVYVYDKAAPNKVGRSLAKYSVLKSSIQYKGGLLTQKDIQLVNETIEAIMKVASADEYKAVCKKYKIDVENAQIEQPNDYEMELIEKSKSTKKPSVLQSMEDENKLTVLFVKNEEISDAVVPSEQEISEIVSSKKIANEFNKNLKRLKTTAFVKVYKERLEKVFQ